MHSGAYIKTALMTHALVQKQMSTKSAVMLINCRSMTWDLFESVSLLTEQWLCCASLYVSHCVLTRATSPHAAQASDLSTIHKHTILPKLYLY